MEHRRELERDPDTLWRSTLRGVLVNPPGTDRPVLLTTPGDAVWRALGAPCSLEVLVRDLAAAFDAPTSQIAADLEPVLDDLMALGAIRYRQSQP